MNITEQMNRKELTEARTSNRKVFENQDHSRTVEIYLEPVHYQDTDGSWRNADSDSSWEVPPVLPKQGYRRTD